MRYEIAPYRPEFRPGVIALHQHLVSADSSLNDTYFRWKHERNPYTSKPIAYVALRDGKVAGMRAFLGARWSLGQGNGTASWLCACDLVVDPAQARSSARALLARSAAQVVVVGEFRDCLFQTQYAELKAMFENLRKRTEADIILSHRLEDRHQDHRLVAEPTWNTWRDHVILEYEIPKYEGDLVTPNVYVPIPVALARRKIRHLERNFGSQRGKDWFTPETFLGLMRIRGLESRSKSGLAEGFHARKLTLA